MKRSVFCVLTLCGMAASAAIAGTTLDAAASRFEKSNPGSSLYKTDGRITTVYGNAFSSGGSPEESAAAFITQHLAMLGAVEGDLVPGSLAADDAATREIMFDRVTGNSKFTIVAFRQVRDSIPVFRSDVRMLVRNEAGFPLVLVKNALRDLGDFRVDAGVAADPRIEIAFERAATSMHGFDRIEDVQTVIFAGNVDAPSAPRLATTFIASRGQAGDAGYDKRLFVADAATGRIIMSESQIHEIDVTGNVSAVATPGKKADICTTETTQVMPYARVNIGATVAYTDANGNFTIPNAGNTQVTVQSGVRGRWFRVYSPSVDAAALSLNVTPPGPANFVHNQANTVEKTRAEVNAYVQSNIVRDMVLTHAPTFPTIVNQAEFRVNVQVSGTCNAFYDGSSINFYPAGGGCANTAFGDVVHHEYGHHLVAVAGSGQGMYGEGYGDLMGIVISDEPVLGYGFQNNCNAGIRTAVNNLQYPCGGEIHECGQLITGAFWETRNELVITNPSSYKTIMQDLAVNSVLLHNGTEITPQVTIDVLTIDDNDANIGNGTPHYPEIAQGFGEHNLDAPALEFLAFSYPNGRPAFVNPFGGTDMRVVITNVSGSLQSNTAVLHADPEADGSYAMYPMTLVSGSTYDAVFPASTCGKVINYYVSAKTTTNQTDVDPNGAPANVFQTIAGDSTTTVFNDNFQTNLGWAVSSTATAGQWQRGIPANGNRGDPAADYDGSGQCYVTQNVAGDSDVDGGSTTLTSPTMNASGGGEAILSYARWFSNDFGNAPFTDTFDVQVSNNNGASWVNVEIVGPSGSEVSGGWFFKTFALSTKIALTNQMKVRYTANDIDVNTQSVVEAGVDAVSLKTIVCNDCPPDFNGDGFLTGDDFDLYVAAFEAGVIAADYNGDGFVTGDDFDLYVADFEAGCGG